MYGQPYYGPPPGWPPQQPPAWGPSTPVVWVPAPPGTDLEKAVKLLDKLERRRVRKEEEAKKNVKKEEPKKLGDRKFSFLEAIGLVFIGYWFLMPMFKAIQLLN